MMRKSRAFTLVELLIVIAVAAILMMLAAPSFRDFILLQRLKGIHAQVMTDVQLARSEAAARGVPVRIRLGLNDAVTCYTLYTGLQGDCSCISSPVCPADGPAREVRTVVTAKDLGVQVVVPQIEDIDSIGDFAFDPVTGGVVLPSSDERDPLPQEVNIDTTIDPARAIRTKVSPTGRPWACAPQDSTLAAAMGLPAC